MALGGDGVEDTLSYPTVVLSQLVATYLLFVESAWNAHVEPIAVFV